MASEKKRVLREELRRELRALSPLYRQEADAQIAASLLSLPEYREARCVYCYCSVEEEINTRPILQAVLRDGKTLCLPVVEGRRMTARRLTDLGTLTEGKYGIPVPPEGEPTVPEAEIDLVVVPGLAFDLGGFRLGQGGGYYDRLLGGISAVAVGLCREEQIRRELPTEPHDQAVDILITERSVARLR